MYLSRFQSTAWQYVGLLSRNVTAAEVAFSLSFLQCLGPLLRLSSRLENEAPMVVESSPFQVGAIPEKTYQDAQDTTGVSYSRWTCTSGLVSFQKEEN